MTQETAFITGGANGIGLDIARFLTKKGLKVFIVDLNKTLLEPAAKELNSPYAVVDVADWDSQHTAYKEAVRAFGRIDYVYPIAGIGENTWMPPPLPEGSAGGEDFLKPNLSIIDVNVKGLLYTVTLAVQQFRRQGLGQHGFKGKIICPGSIMGIYPCPHNAMYNTSKHAITGLVRSYGLQLSEENITMNAFAPSSIKTGFSKDTYYQQLEKEDLLTTMDGVYEVVEMLLGDDPTSGEIFEIGPNYHKGTGLHKPKFPDYCDEATERVFELIIARGNAK